MSRQNVRRVLGTHATLECTFTQVAENPNDRHHYSQRQSPLQRQVRKKPEVGKHGHRRSGDQTTHYALPGFSGAYSRSKLMFPETFAHVVRGCVGAHYDEKEERK